MKRCLLLSAVLWLGTSSALYGQTNPGTFTFTGSMGEQRQIASATLISGCNCPADGKVLVAGGVINGLSFTTNTAELYDPSTGKFTPTGTMNVARGGQVAALLPGGKVLIVGAFDSPGPEDAEIYDPVAGTFSCVAGVDPATGHCNPTLVQNSGVLTATSLQNGKVFITGLQTPASAGQGSNAAAIYDSLQATFTCINGMSSTPGVCNPSMSTKHTSGTATLLGNGTVLIAGGINTVSYTSSAEIYDPTVGTNGTFVATGSMLVTRGSHTATLLKTGEVLITGGSTDTGNFNISNLNTAEVYLAGNFTAVGNMAHVRVGHTATLLNDGTALISGGCCEVSNLQLQYAEIYDPTTRTFSPAGDMNSARATHTSTLLPNGQVLVAGGFFDSTAELYTPNSTPPLSPAVSLSTNSLNFPNQTVNTTSGAMQVTVTNSGNAALNITATPTITGTNASDFAVVSNRTTCQNGATIAPRNSCVINVTFKPSTTAGESATLFIYDNASKSPQTVSMTGSGVAVVPPPIIQSVQPNIITQGTTVTNFTVTGTGFQPNATLFLGADISVTPPSLNPQGQLMATLTVASTAASGCRDVTLTNNPDGLTSILPCGAFVVSSVPPPPDFLQVVVGNNQVLLRWAPVVTFPPITSYKITVEVFNTQTLSYGFYGSKLVTPDQTSMVLGVLDGGPQLQNGVLYRFTVAGIRVGVNGQSTQPVAGMPNSFQLSAAVPPHPVMFVHGIMKPTADDYWKPTVDYLKQSLGWKFGGVLKADPSGGPTTIDESLAFKWADGRTAFPVDFYTVLFSDPLANNGGIEKQGNEVASFIKKLWDRNGTFPKLSVFAHSMGGLASRAYLQSFTDGASKVDELITYGTPHLGVVADDLRSQYNFIVQKVSEQIENPVDRIKADFILGFLTHYRVDGILLNSHGLDEMATCGGTVFPFLGNLNRTTATSPYGRLPAGLTYKFLAGQFQLIDKPPSISFSDSNGQILGNRKNLNCPPLQDINGIMYTDGIVPLRSADPYLTGTLDGVTLPPYPLPSAFSQLDSSKVFTERTSRAHWEESTDIPNILCSLTTNCLVAKAHSPVDLEVIQSDSKKIGVDLTQIPGASYDVVHDSPQHETEVVTIPFPAPGPYTIRIIPKAGALPSDTYSISLTQNGITHWVAQNVPVAAIPPTGYQIHPNSAPVPRISGPATVQATGPNGAIVTFLGSAVDPDGDPVSLRWTGAFGDVVGSVLTTTMPIGTNRLVLVATDSHGATGTIESLIVVTPAPPPFVNLAGSVQMPLSRDSNGNFVAIVTVKNQGNVTVNSAQANVTGTTLGSTAPITAPAAITNLAPGASATVILIFPKAAASSGATTAPLKISGTYNAGTLTGNWSLTFRSVTLP